MNESQINYTIHLYDGFIDSSVENTTLLISNRQIATTAKEHFEWSV